MSQPPNKSSEQSSNRSSRTAARTASFQALYQEDLNPDAAQFADDFLRDEVSGDAVRVFAKTLLDGARLYKSKIDAAIEGVATNWSVSRMAATDRNILRMAIYEMWYIKTPPAVVITEAVDLAREFGTKDSAAFVNGILEKVKEPH
ncbi:MAG: transcription antitermination factor NusB [Thermoguttaceae bacterium]